MKHDPHGTCGLETGKLMRQVEATRNQCAYRLNEYERKIMDEIEQRKQAAANAGYTNPMCASCANMGTPTSKRCRDCMRDTPMFTAAVKDFLTEVKGTRQ